MTSFFAAVLAAAFCVSACLSGCSTTVTQKTVSNSPPQETSDTKAWKPGGPRVSDSILASYRTGLIDPRARSIQAYYHQVTVGETEKFLNQLTLQLLKGIEDPFAKIKLIHDWICASFDYDVDMLKNNFAYDQDLQHILASKKAVCSGYSRLFQVMAEDAGFPCIVVSGYGKGIGENRIIDSSNSHAWNLVMVRGAWYIVDTTFDAGSIRNNKFVRSYSTNFLFIDPKVNIYTHFPKRPEFQLLGKPINASGFLALPDLDLSFFSYGLHLIDPSLRWSTATSGDFSLAFGVDSNEIMLEASVAALGGAEIAGAAMIQRFAKGTQQALIRLPEKAVYEITLFAKPVDTSADPLQPVMTFRLNNSKPSRYPRFPIFYAHYEESPKDSLLEPIAGVLHIGDTIRFRYVAPLSTYAILIAGDEMIQMEKGSGRVFEADLRITDSKNVRLATSTDGNVYWISVEWLVENAKK